MRLALVSVHSSPVAQPGAGHAGGMNVYIRELATRVRARGHEVEFVTEPRDLGEFDVVHSHYWKSGLVAFGHGVPVVHSMHTLGLVKAAEGSHPEPADRIDAELRIVAAADRLVANTTVEGDELVGRYGADRERIAVVHPGVDTEVFAPVADPSRDYVVFAGRLQPLKGVDVLLRAAALLADVDVVVIGGRSGPAPYDLAGLHDRVRFLPPLPQPELARWLANAALVAMPSHSESFGLVALEAQACGTPVLAARVGGLPTVVVDGVTGVLVDGHDPARWADALAGVLADPAQRAAMGAKAVAHAEGFSWDATASALLAVYESTMRTAR